MTRKSLKNKNAAEKARIKSEEIVRVGHVGRFSKDKLEIEIQGLGKLERGVEVFVRAWKEGKPLGFGSKGDVEIERIRIYNPPILVPDPNGDVICEWDDIDGNHHIKIYREDPQEALRQTLAHTISLIGQEDTEIVGGKVGNTTSTFHPDPSVEVSTFDGFVRNTTGADYAAVQSATDGDVINDTSTGDRGIRNSDVGGSYSIFRSAFLFDTSSIPDTDSITSATFSLYGTGSASEDVDTDSVSVVASTPASNTAIALGDFDQFGTTKLATDITIASWNTGAYNDFTLNASGLAAISKTGITKLGARTAKDISATTPTGENYVFTHYADQTGTTNDPKLVVVHASATSVKTVNGLAVASVKTVDGLAIASVKSFNGLT